MFNIIDEFTRECLAIRIDRKLSHVYRSDVPNARQVGMSSNMARFPMETSLNRSGLGKVNTFSVHCVDRHTPNAAQCYGIHTLGAMG